MADFAVLSAAVACAIALQRGIRNQFAASGVPIRLRIGIHAGEPIDEDDDLHGVADGLGLRRRPHELPGAALQRSGDLEAALAEIVEACHGLDPLHAETRATSTPASGTSARWSRTSTRTSPSPDATLSGIDYLHTLLHSDRAPK